MENRPVPLKPPVWTWEVPAYFFVGGAAGAAAVIAAVAGAWPGDALVARDARWIAAAGALLSPLLLVSDLGRPSRFLFMLRVFKLQSPMSIGAWTLVAFANTVAAALVLHLWRDAGHASAWVSSLTVAADLATVVAGLALVTYTGVLLGATAIPVWSSHVRLLPFDFGASAFGAAVSLLEVLGHRTAPLNAIGIGAAVLETVIWIALERRADADAWPLRTGSTGHLSRAADVFSGPVPLVLRLAGPHAAVVRLLAAGSMIAGSVLTRVAWVQAGRVSAVGARR